MENKNLEIVREACIKANPEIMELGFGCGVKYGEGIFKHYTLYCGTLSDDKVVLYMWNIGEPIRVSKDQLETFGEILGRPIRLADVLKTVGKKTNNAWAVESRLGALLEWGSNGDGVMAFYEPAGKDRPCWNLNKDDLSLQTDETLQFLATLLTN